MYSLRLRLFGKQIMVRTSTQTRSEAKRVEMAVLTAYRSGDYRALDPMSRETCLRIFRNQGWELPADLGGGETVTKELTLWEAVEIFLNYPTVKDCRAKERYVFCLANLVEKLGKDRPVKGIWVPDIRQYQAARLSDGVKPATINWETSTLSRLFGVLAELQYVQTNPVRLIKRLSTKAGERQAYIGHEDFKNIVSRCPEWYQPFLWLLYSAGMRRSEALLLTRKRLDLRSRIIYLGPQHTKEGAFKRVPIHRDLVSHLEDAMRVTSLTSDRVFLVKDSKGVRPPSHETIKNPWRRALKKMDMDPKPRLHDIRHSWRTNARRSKMDPVIAESILGHWYREKTVNERYGFISDEELVETIDRMTFDHGKTKIWGAGQ